MIGRAACGAALLAVVTTVAGCDSAPPVQPNARQVTVVGTGEVKGVPDTLTADVGIEVVAPDVTAAMNQTNDRQRAVIDALVTGGIEAKDISTTAVNLSPQYGENSEINGYRASNFISVRIRQLDNATSVLSTVVATGGNAARINSVSFSIADDSKLVSDARAKAFEDAKAHAQQYANLAGMSLGRVISISEAPGGSPGPMPVPTKAAAADVPLQPGEQSVSFAVTAIWELD